VICLSAAHVCLTVFRKLRRGEADGEAGKAFRLPYSNIVQDCGSATPQTEEFIHPFYTDNSPPSARYRPLSSWSSSSFSSLKDQRPIGDEESATRCYPPIQTERRLLAGLRRRVLCPFGWFSDVQSRLKVGAPGAPDGEEDDKETLL